MKNKKNKSKRQQNDKLLSDLEKTTPSKPSALRRRKGHLNQNILFFCFFVSGFCSLALEICWIKKASFIFGTTIYAMSAVTSVFFLGLAAGNILGIRQLKKNLSPLKVFGLCQLAVGVLGVLTPLLFLLCESIYGWLYAVSQINVALQHLVSVLLISVVVFLPTLAMGISFPVLHGYFVVTQSDVAKVPGRLFGINALGALGGAILTGFILLPFWGINATIYSLSLINAGLFFVINLVSLKNQTATSSRLAVPMEKTVKHIGKRPTPKVSFMVILFFLAGYVAMANEILWARYLSLLIQNTVYMYTLTIAAVLAGIAVGNFVSGKIKGHQGRLLTALGLLHLLVAASVLGISSLSPESWQRLLSEKSFYAQYGVLLLILFVPAVFSSVAFVLGIRIVTTQPGRIRRIVGLLNGFNIIGGIAGLLLAGFFMLPLLGLQVSLYVTCALSLICGFIALFLMGNNLRLLVRVCIWGFFAGAWCIAVLFLNSELPRRFLADESSLIDFREGINANLAVVKNKVGVPSLEINKLWQGDEVAGHQMMAAHVPMLLHQSPDTVLVIGAGIGHAAKRFLYYDIKSMAVVEIEKELPGLLKKHFDMQWTKDPRVEQITDDGRNYLRFANKKYDVVSIEVGQLFRPGCADFYTVDFYEIAKNALNEQGVVCQFVPLVFLKENDYRALIHSFITVFPNSTLWFNNYELLIVGAKGPSKKIIAERFENSIVNSKIKNDLDFYYWGGPGNRLSNIDTFAGGYLMGPNQLKTYTQTASVFRDDDTRLTYLTARHQDYDGKQVLKLITQMKQYLSAPNEIFEKEIGPEVQRKIEGIREKNLNNISAMDLYKSYLSSKKINLLQSAHRLNPDNTVILYEWARYLGNQKQYLKAISLFLKLLKLDNRHGRACQDLAFIYQTTGKIDNALHYYKKCLELQVGNTADVHNNIAVIYAKQRNLKNAKLHFEKALRHNPALKSAQKNLKRVNQLLLGKD